MRVDRRILVLSFALLAAPLVAAPQDAISARSFTGTLSVAEVKRDPRSLEPLLGVSMVRSGQGWKLGGKV